MVIKNANNFKLTEFVLNCEAQGFLIPIEVDWGRMKTKQKKTRKEHWSNYKAITFLIGLTLVGLGIDLKYLTVTLIGIGFVVISMNVLGDLNDFR